jgi:hypothetical protein
MKRYNESSIKENDKSSVATVFFIPKKVGQMMVGKYRHCGIIYGKKTYEIWDGIYNYMPVIQDLKSAMPHLKREKAVFFETKIHPEKIDREINSKTSSAQFVLRVMGMSNLKDAEKGSLCPSDVHKIIGRKKYGCLL